MTAASATSALPLPPTAPAGTVPNPRFAELADEGRVERAVAALEERGFTTYVVNDRAEALDRLLGVLPSAGTILEASSQSLVAIGLSGEQLRAKGLEPVKPRLMELMMAQKADEARRLGAAPDVVVGSVHAITEAGQVLVASASGSQLGPYVSGAGRVIWVVGTQKLVKDLEEAEARLEEYTFPLENARAQKAYGRGSMVGKVLLYHREARPGRVTIILVRENLGY